MTFKLHRILVVGVGSIGERHVRCFQATCRAVVSICDTNVKLLDQVGSEYQVDSAYSSFDEAIEYDFDAVVIATPANLHVEMATRVMKDRPEIPCHVLIEKPLSTKLEGIDELAEAATTSGRHVSVGYVMRSHPSLIAMKSCIESQRFGRPLQLYLTSGQHFPLYRPAYREIYYRDRKTGGGAIQDALTHGINAAEWLVGPIECLAADAAHQRLEGVDVEDTVGVVARHGKVLATYTLNQYQAPNEMTITVVCEHGTVRFEYHHARWCWMTKPDTLWREEVVEDFQRDTIFVAQANAFLDAIEGKKPVVCSLQDGLQTLKVNLAVLAAVENRSWISL